VVQEDDMAPTLPRRRLGLTGIEVAALGFGSAPLGDIYSVLDDTTAIDAVRQAHQAGVTLFDTAPHYGHGLAEHRIGTALRGVPRDKFVLSTKVGRRMEPRLPRIGESRFVGGFPHRGVYDYSYDGVWRAVEQSLIRLGLDRVDFLLIHDADRWTHGDAGDARFKEAMDGAYVALDQLRAQKVIRGIGVGLNDAGWLSRFARAGDFDVMLCAGRYSLLEQPALEELLPLAQEKGIGILLGGVYNSGILATGTGPNARYNYQPPPPEIAAKVDRIAAVCERHQVALPRAAVHFPLGHPAVGSVVLGAVTPDEVTRNAAMLAQPVPADLWRELKAEKLLDEAAPTPA
jgi:D-threo-aldose 1-dehydrogenase